MASGINKLAKAVADILRRDDTDRGYDTTAEVKRIEDGTAWVHFPGGEDETPVRMTVNANVGDNVQVRVSGGRAFIIGNGSAPPTDDTRANYAAFAANRAQVAADKAEEDAIYAAKRAAEANERAQAAQDVATATSQHFWTDDGGVHVSSEASNATATRNTLWNSLGMLFRKGANILLAITTGTTPSIDFYDGAGNAGSNIIASFGSAGVRIGTANATQIVLDSTNGLKLGTKVSISPSGAAKFDGEVQSTSGKIGGWDITSSSLKGEHNNKGTGFQIPSSGTWAIAVGYDTSGSGWGTAPFRVNHNGEMWATNAHVTGAITASSGNIGGWSVSNNYQIGFLDAVTFGTASTQYQVFVRSNRNENGSILPPLPTSAAFGIQHREYNGSTYGSWVNDFIVRHDGTVEASKGIIAGWNIDSNSIYYGTKSSGTAASDVTLMSSSTFTRSINGTSRSSLKFAIGSKFGVNSSGVMYAADGVFSGTITGSAGEFTKSFHVLINGTGSYASHQSEIKMDNTELSFVKRFGSGSSAAAAGLLITNNTTTSVVGLIGHQVDLAGLTYLALTSNDIRINGNVTTTIKAKVSSGHTRTLVGTQDTDGENVAIIRQHGSTSASIYSQNGTAGSSYGWHSFTVSSSDIRLKKNVEDCEVEDALSVINRIKMHSFDWLHTDEHQRIGFIADELEEIDPKLAMGGGKEKDGTINYKSVDTFYMMGYLVKAVQELSEQNRKLTAELNALKEVVK